METARDLACPELWQQSLERSLARRGRPTRSSLELFRLQPERDLAYGEFIRESARYSELRRSAMAKRHSMALPGAGGISALALLAAATVPGLLGGRGAAATGRPRIAYRADASASALPERAAESLAAGPKLAAAAASTSGLNPAAATAPAPATLASTRPPAAPVRPTHIATAPATPAVHHIALAHDASGGAGTTASSGGAAPAVSHAARPAPTPATQAPAPAHTAPTAPSKPTTSSHSATPVHVKPAAHAHTGGGAVERQSPTRPATHSPAPAHHQPAKPHPQPTPHPRPVTATKPHPVTATKPAPKPKPKPVATTKPAPKPAPTPKPAPASGTYVNPLAGADVTPERIDQGVDYSGSGPLSAIGDGRITYAGTSGTGWPGAFVEYQLTDGPDAGRYVYYAEGITPAPGLQVGQTVQAGQRIAQIIAGSSSGIEIGWGSGVGTQTLAEADGHWSGGDDDNSIPSPEGESFSALIASLGGPPGKIEG